MLTLPTPYGRSLMFGIVPYAWSVSTDVTGTVFTLRFNCPAYLNVGIVSGLDGDPEIDATGLFFTANFLYASDLAFPTGTADGSEFLLTYVSGEGTDTWVYAITEGNPSGDPILDGAVVLWSAAAGLWRAASGVPSAAVVDAVVVNNSVAV